MTKREKSIVYDFGCGALWDYLPNMSLLRLKLNFNTEKLIFSERTSRYNPLQGNEIPMLCSFLLLAP